MDKEKSELAKYIFANTAGQIIGANVPPDQQSMYMDRCINAAEAFIDRLEVRRSAEPLPEPPKAKRGGRE